MVETFIHKLEKAIQAEASREMLGYSADTIELPDIYREFLKHTFSIHDGRWNGLDFLCAFGGLYPPPEKRVEPLQELESKSQAPSYDVAAGFVAGEHVALQQWSYICYLLCRPERCPEADHHWSRRIFVVIPDDKAEHEFESFNDFLAWYSGVYKRTPWNSVKHSIQRSFAKIEARHVE